MKLEARALEITGVSRGQILERKGLRQETNAAADDDDDDDNDEDDDDDNNNNNNRRLFLYFIMQKAVQYMP